jgi:hypothetical protein
MLKVPSSVGFNEGVDICNRMRNRQKLTLYGLLNKLHVMCKIMEDAVL